MTEDNNLALYITRQNLTLEEDVSNNIMDESGIPLVACLQLKSQKDIKFSNFSDKNSLHKKINSKNEGELSEEMEDRSSCSSGIPSIRKDDPPSYEAYINDPSPTYLSEIQENDSSIVSRYSTDRSEYGQKIFLPPYFQLAESSRCIDHLSCNSISNQNLLCTNSETALPIDDCCNDHNSLQGKFAFINENFKVSIPTNLSRNYDVESIDQDAFLNNYQYNNENRPLCNSNSLDAATKESRRAIDTIDYIKTFLSSKEDVIYEDRRKRAMNILNMKECHSNRKKALKDNFWIIEDEPLVGNGIEAKEVDQILTEVKLKKGTASREYICHICGKILNGRNSFGSHIKTHRRMTYKCQFCSRKFAHVCSLKYHTRTHTQENPYVCVTCSKPFKALSNLNKHKLVHSDVRPFKCSVCGKTFKSNINLNLHRKCHSIQVLKCQMCTSVFESRKSLSTHIEKKHNVEKAYSCSSCKKSYQYQSLLKQHMKVHLNECPYSCHLCGSAFVWRSGLASHLKTHSFKLQCEICSHKFTSLKKLDKHLRNHSNPLPHKCVKCNKEFKFAYLLKAHATRHKDHLACSACNLSFITKSKLQKHLKTHGVESKERHLFQVKPCK